MTRFVLALCLLSVPFALVGCGNSMGDYVLTVPDMVAPAGGEGVAVVRLQRNDFLVMAPPVKDAVTADGEVVVPLDAEAFGFWLKAAFGDPATTGTGP